MKKLLKSKSLIFTSVLIVLYILISVLMFEGKFTRSQQAILLKMCSSIILAMSLNLVVGSLGELSLGHAGFFCVGAYAGGYFAVNANLPLPLVFVIALIIGGITGALFGFFISSTILRLRGDYLAIVTLAYGELIRSFVKIIPALGGTRGLIGVPSLGARGKQFLYMFAVVIVSFILISNFTRSRHGRAINSIRDNAIAAQSIGININRYKVMTFTISAFFAGMAGVVFAFFKSNLEPSDFTYNLSIEALLMVVFGGMGNLFGSVVAAAAITALPEILRDAEEYRLLIYAISLILLMIFTSNPKLVELRKRIMPKTLFAGRRKEGATDDNA